MRINMGITGAEPAGDRPSGKFGKVIGWKVSGKVYDCWNLRGPPLGEAPARSSLVPRDLTAELCLMPLASLGLSACADTPCGLFESACSILCLSLRLGLFLL